jgi:hypothetical protein
MHHINTPNVSALRASRTLPWAKPLTTAWLALITLAHLRQGRHTSLPVRQNNIENKPYLLAGLRLGVRSFIITTIIAIQKYQFLFYSYTQMFVCVNKVYTFKPETMLKDDNNS